MQDILQLETGKGGSRVGRHVRLPVRKRHTGLEEIEQGEMCFSKEQCRMQATSDTWIAAANTVHPAAP